MPVVDSPRDWSWSILRAVCENWRRERWALRAWTRGRARDVLERKLGVTRRVIEGNRDMKWFQCPVVRVCGRVNCKGEWKGDYMTGYFVYLLIMLQLSAYVTASSSLNHLV